MAYERKKPQILLLDRWEKTIAEDLTDEEAGKILKAMYKYFNHGDHPAFQDRLLRWFWEDIEKWLNDSREWYKGFCETRAEAGKASGESRRKKREQVPTSVNNNEQVLTSVNTGQHRSTSVNIDNDNVLMPNDNVQCLMFNDKSIDNDKYPSNIQSTSLLDMKTKNGSKELRNENAQQAAGKQSEKSLDGWNEKNPQREAEALRINPGNFKKHYIGADDLDGKTVIRYCKLRSDMIRNGADPAEVDRGIQKEISGA